MQRARQRQWTGCRRVVLLSVLAALAPACGGAATAARLIVDFDAALAIDQIQVAVQLNGTALTTQSVPKTAAGAIAGGRDVVVLFDDGLAGRAIDFVVTGRAAGVTVARGRAAVTLVKGRTAAAHVTLAATNACPSGQIDCGSGCTDPQWDPASCGSCAVSCGHGEVCDRGSCVPNPCPDGQHECAGTCEADDDPAHCGMACATCAAPTTGHGSAACARAQCTFTCDSGFSPCTGGCIATDSDPQNCGGCGLTCAATEVCQVGVCSPNTCGPGFHACGGACVTNADVAHCGGACDACPAPAHGNASCDGTSCGAACQTGYHACGAQCASDTEVATCGTRCTPCPSANGTASCVAGACHLACSTGFHDCGGACVANTDPASCGASCDACPVPTNGAATCNGTSCGVSCATGYTRCGAACVPQAQGCAGWEQRATTGPAARIMPGMAYDAVRRQTVLFGGWSVATNADLNDTWEWNGTAWREVTTGDAPVGRDSVAMAYDAARRLVVLFGGWDASNNVLDDTWTYDGATWAQLAPAAAPTARHSAAAAWRPAANELLLFGGAVPDAMGGDTLLGDLWAWNGTTWRAITTSGTSAPAARLGVGLIGDAGTDELVLFGGAQTWDLQNVMGDMWRHDATGWTKFTGATPPARGAPGFVYDGADAVGILFGGVGTGGASLVDTWSWSGATLQWTEQSPSASPPARGQAGMAFDSTRNVVVLFGGADGNNDYADTWEYTY